MIYINEKKGDYKMGKYLDETGTQFLVDKIKEGSAGGG